MQTSSYISLNTNMSDPNVRVNVRWTGHVVVIQELGYLSSTAEKTLQYLGAFVMLFSCRGRERNGLQYGERPRKQQLCKHGFHQVCSRESVSVRGSVAQEKKLSFGYLMLSSPLVLQSANADLI